MNYTDIELEGIDVNGNQTKMKLADLKGKNIILYFYPKDETPICTKEAQHFRDAISKLPEDTVVIGVSPDNIESHKKFFENHKLNFKILSDTEHKLARAFKNLKNDVEEKASDIKDKMEEKRIEMKIKHAEKQMEKEWKKSKDKPITMRSTFIIGKDGNLLKEMRDIDIRGHVDEVVEYVKNL